LQEKVPELFQQGSVIIYHRRGKEIEEKVIKRTLEDLT
jgi:hypothetical protein